MKLNDNYDIQFQVYEGDKATGNGKGKFCFRVKSLRTGVDTFITKETLLELRNLIDKVLKES